MAPPVPEPGFVAPIVVGTDGSAVSYQAVAWAATEAALHGCALRVVTSVGFRGSYGPVPFVTEDLLELMRADGERIVKQAGRITIDFTSPDPVEVDEDVTLESIIPALIARSRTARILVVGSRGRGAFQRALLGSVSSAMVHHAHCPVAVIGSTAETDPVAARMPVLVGVDGSANNVPAVAVAFEEAALRGVDLVALRCWSDASGGASVRVDWDQVQEKEFAVLAENLAVHRDRYPEVVVRSIVAREQPARALLAASADAQLVVVGSRGRGGFAGMLLGSTSWTLVQSVDCPIIVVREHAAEPGIRPAQPQ
ncbi:universal stress protein [Nocardia vaccinii]|uniref:universal stress protein n=1 Tax=Nocardia vaccinii TaxID=1822 RepID=UPI000831E5A9|nr:universal stress protein [Nocardia vaccinii]